MASMMATAALSLDSESEMGDDAIGAREALRALLELRRSTLMPMMPRASSSGEASSSSGSPAASGAADGAFSSSRWEQAIVLEVQVRCRMDKKQSSGEEWSRDEKEKRGSIAPFSFRFQKKKNISSKTQPPPFSLSFTGPRATHQRGRLPRGAPLRQEGRGAPRQKGPAGPVPRGSGGRPRREKQLRNKK